MYLFLRSEALLQSFLTLVFGENIVALWRESPCHAGSEFYGAKRAVPLKQRQLGGCCAGHAYKGEELTLVYKHTNAFSVPS